MKPAKFPRGTTLSPFVRLKAESVDWAGYNPELIDEVYDYGVMLEKDNTRYRMLSPGARLASFWQGIGRVIGTVIGLACAGGFVIAMTALIRSDRYPSGYSDGYGSGARAAVAYIEAQRIGVDVERVRVELPNGPYGFSLRDYTKSQGYSDPGAATMEAKRGDWQKAYPRVYTVFVQPTAGPPEKP